MSTWKTILYWLHFNPKAKHLVYYGPHPCPVCGHYICKVAFEQGGQAYDYPESIIYPNTPWTPHVCTVYHADLM